MKRSKLIALKEKLSLKSSTPWACFETNGPSEDGKIEFAISWNNSFINKLRKAGFEGTTDEELVQLFFLSARMIPENMINDDIINPEATPNLTNEANILKR